MKKKYYVFKVTNRAGSTLQKVKANDLNDAHRKLSKRLGVKKIDDFIGKVSEPEIHHKNVLI